MTDAKFTDPKLIRHFTEATGFFKRDLVITVENDFEHIFGYLQLHFEEQKETLLQEQLNFLEDGDKDLLADDLKELKVNDEESYGDENEFLKCNDDLSTSTNSSEANDDYNESKVLDFGNADGVTISMEKVNEQNEAPKDMGNEPIAEKALSSYALFLKFLMKSYADEEELQLEFVRVLKKFLPTDRIVEKERSHENRSRSDVIISKGPGKIKGKKKIGRPCCLIELKRPPKKDFDFSLDTHKYQLLNYVRQLIGTHVSVALIPFLLFNGKSYFIGLAKWQNYALFEIVLDKFEYQLFNEYNACFFIV